MISDLSPFQLLDYAGVAVFAATGALTAARKNHDIITFGFFAAVTGIGGGTLRDLLIGAPVFWVLDPGYLITSLGAALAVWLLRVQPHGMGPLLWLDALGLGAYAVIGAAKALAFGVPAPVAVVMGVLTCTFGGVVRDVLANEPSILLRREIYVTAALAGSIVYVAAHLAHVPSTFAAGLGFIAGFGVRAGALIFGWSMPGFKPRGADQAEP